MAKSYNLLKLLSLQNGVEMQRRASAEFAISPVSEGQKLMQRNDSLRENLDISPVNYNLFRMNSSDVKMNSFRPRPTGSFQDE